MLNILEASVRQLGLEHLRIDGGVDGRERGRRVELFQTESSEQCGQAGIALPWHP